MVTSSGLESKSVSIFLFAAKMTAIENKNSNHVAAPRLLPCHATPFVMIQLQNGSDIRSRSHRPSVSLAS